MEKARQKQIKDYKTKEIAALRAKREASSSPIPEEISIYRTWLKRAIKNKKEPKVLILGATPELRDLCLGLELATFSADISWDVIDAMTKVMRTQGNEKEIIINTNWLDLDKYLKANLFDVVMGDISISNLRAEEQKRLLGIIYKLLRKNGYFISRCDIFLPNKKRKSFEEIYSDYLSRKTNWLGFIVEYCWYGPKRGEIYNAKSGFTDFKKMFSYFFCELKEKKPKLRDNDLEKFENLISHGKNVIHVVFPKEIFEKMLKKYFRIVTIEKIKYTFSEFHPIYILKKK